MSKNSASQRDHQRVNMMTTLLCAKTPKLGLTRVFSRHSLAAAASKRLPYGLNVDAGQVTELWPRLEAAVRTNGMHVVRPLWQHHFGIWASTEDFAYMMNAAERHEQVYRRILRDLYNGAALDTIADHGSTVDFRVAGSLIRSNDNTFVHTYEQLLAQVQQARATALAGLKVEYETRVKANLVVV